MSGCGFHSYFPLHATRYDNHNSSSYSYLPYAYKDLNAGDWKQAFNSSGRLRALTNDYIHSVI